MSEHRDRLHAGAQPSAGSVNALFRILAKVLRKRDFFETRCSNGSSFHMSATPTFRPSVLIVEDEPLIRMLASNVFDESGFDVVEAANADEAFELLGQTSRWDALFTDIDMPGSMNGLELARACSRIHPETAVLITSGKGRPLHQAMPRDAQFVVKPYDLQKTVTRVWHMIESRIDATFEILDSGTLTARYGR